MTEETQLYLWKITNFAKLLKNGEIRWRHTFKPCAIRLFTAPSCSVIVPAELDHIHETNSQNMEQPAQGKEQPRYNFAASIKNNKIFTQHNLYPRFDQRSGTKKGTGAI